MYLGLGCTSKRPVRGRGVSGGVMMLIIFVAVSWGVGRWTARVLRVLIRFEALSIVALVGVVYCRVLGAFQVFVCLAVLTAVVGLTTWVTGN